MIKAISVCLFVSRDNNVFKSCDKLLPCVCVCVSLLSLHIVVLQYCSLLCFL